jgi:hypothetical protein
MKEKVRDRKTDYPLCHVAISTESTLISNGNDVSLVERNLGVSLDKGASRVVLFPSTSLPFTLCTTASGQARNKTTLSRWNNCMGCLVLSIFLIEQTDSFMCTKSHSVRFPSKSEERRQSSNLPANKVYACRIWSNL